jgi:hypothetical protein
LRTKHDKVSDVLLIAAELMMQGQC